LTGELSPRSRFAIHILRLQWPDLGLKYTKREVWPLLAATDLDDGLLALSEADIQTYDWDRQEVWLNETGIARLADAWTEDVGAALGRAFVVTLDDARIYGGLFYYEGGAAAIRFPVIHLIGRPAQGLRIRPSMGETCDDPVPRVAEHCRTIADARILDWFVQRGLCGRR
jgi:hypothetical protein